MMTREDEEYLLEKINSAFAQKWHKVTPEYLVHLEKKRKERQKQKKEKTNDKI